MKKIYLDYNASTPLAPEACEAMEPFLTEAYGNPMSLHWAGESARAAIDKARVQVARLIAASPGEVIFTSGGSESNNAAIKGVLLQGVWTDAPHVITTVVEHPAVTTPCQYLERLGAAVTYIPVDRQGLVDPETVRDAIRPNTKLISVMLANNEVGTIQPVAEIGRLAREREIVFHTDAAQAVGKIEVDVEALNVDLLSVAGHKLYGPKGVGALYVRGDTRLEPLLHGGGQEGGRRAGTENALLIVGLGAACELAGRLLPTEGIAQLRDRFWGSLSDRLGNQVLLNGHPTRRLPNTLSVCFPGRIAAQLLARLDGVAASTGSACHAGRVALSGVIAAMGISPEVGMGAVRFSLGRGTTWDELELVVDMLESALARA